MSSKKRWSPGSDIAVQHVERSETGGWIVFGILAPNGICPDRGLHSRRRQRLCGILCPVAFCYAIGKRSSNLIANWLLTACHSRTERFHSVEVGLSAR